MTDFPQAEYEARLARAQALMRADGMDALLLCTEAEFRYFSGFRTLFWQSPTRVWCLLVPADGAPIAVIPEIGADLMAQTWISDIRTFPAPGGEAEGQRLLRSALAGCRRIGLPMGAESSLRMPLADFERLRAGLDAEFTDATPLVRALRMVKSPAEIALLRRICGIGSAAFARAPELFHEGQPLDAAFRAFRIALLEAGADDIPYLVGGAGPGGYSGVISPPDDRALREGDVLMLDTGATLAGYFCDFDRNWAVRDASDDASRMHETLWRATDAGLTAARPGATCADLFHAMSGILGGGSEIGRLGHGLGMQLTEWPSLAPHDNTVLEPGMVLTLEPSLSRSDGRIMVHEENILITDGAPDLLTDRAPRELPVI
ncbi:peptidase M24 [Maritimibacter sp. 55A14]|uniref:M24 family metallopeptidase n=1 Tax=Maritimibacter sp. 55A14 TaxID=2174844 RepID=UPI000D61FB8D|nr:Xaa-Pro peptidase family protein [Maritimibacter sp. 55A14]PWE32417.1 peptidase M24 [Maritimibacter sp. 55A14]